jgi:hypothetical protein
MKAFIPTGPTGLGLRRSAFHWVGGAPPSQDVSACDYRLSHNRDLQAIDVTGVPVGTRAGGTTEGLVCAVSEQHLGDGLHQDLEVEPE